MSNVSYPTSTKPVPHASDVLVEKEKRSIFAFIMLALRCSRRLQASRILRHYEHLIASSERHIPHDMNQNFAGRDMLVASRPAQAKSAAQPPARNEMGWLLAVAAGFVIVHVVAGTIWMHASAHEATTVRSDAAASSYD